MKYINLLLIGLLLTLSCNSQHKETKTVEKKYKYTNALVHETSQFIGFNYYAK